MIIYGHWLTICIYIIPHQIDSFRNEQLTEDELQRHVDELGRLCSVFTERIFSMLSECPIQLRVLALMLNEQVEAKFTDSDWPVAVGGFFFLRYICPAIIAPENVVPELSRCTYTHISHFTCYIYIYMYICNLKY